MLSLSLLGIHGLQKADLSPHRTMKNKLLFLCVRLWENSITYWFRKKYLGKKDFSDSARPQKFFQGLSPPFKKFSTVGPVWRGLRGGSARTDPLHHRGFPHSAARTRATCLPLPADPRAPSLPPPPRAPLRGPALEPAFPYY